MIAGNGRRVRHCIFWMQEAAYRIPIVQIRQIYPSVVIDKHRDFDLHVRSWLDESQWRIVRMCVHQPNANWKVVCIVCNSKLLKSVPPNTLRRPTYS